MTEAEWDTCTEATAMFQFLRGRSGERKMRLLACACARSRWSGLVEDEFRKAVEIAERCADGQAGMKDLREAWEAVWCLGWGIVHGDSDANGAAEACIEDFSAEAAEGALRYMGSSAPDLIREIFGNPFRAQYLDMGRLQRNGVEVQDFARTIYAEHRFQDLTHLADLLAEAGCRNGDLLVHLRSPGPHFRGCWALDAVLGRGPGKDVVSEAEWLGETHPLYMLTWWKYLRGEPSLRKSRLLACACVRRQWPFLADDCLRQAVEFAEAFADGLIGQNELIQAHDRAHALGLERGEILGRMARAEPGWAELASAWNAAHAAADAAWYDHVSYGNAMHHAAQDGGSGKDTEDAGQTALVRDILGNPLRSVALDPTWLVWNDGTIPKIARMIYEERAFDYSS